MRPWHGVLVATALPWRDGKPSISEYQDHVKWLTEQGCDGVVPNGSLGEYQVLTAGERAAVVTAAVEAGARTVIAGVAAYGAFEARQWAEQAAEAGCQAVMLLPPTAYRANETAIIEHYREVSKAGLPIVAYNNPIDTKVDLTPALLAKLAGEGLIVAVKEFSGDVRRGYQIRELAPALDLLAGADDVLMELLHAGAVGWIAGYPNAFPRSCVELYHNRDQRLYELMHPLLRWDSKTEFVQAIKLSMDLAGRYGGPCRPPRLPLDEDQRAAVTEATKRALAEGCA